MPGEILTYDTLTVGLGEDPADAGSAATDEPARLLARLPRLETPTKEADTKPRWQPTAVHESHAKSESQTAATTFRVTTSEPEAVDLPILTRSETIYRIEPADVPADTPATAQIAAAQDPLAKSESYGSQSSDSRLDDDFDNDWAATLLKLQSNRAPITRVMTLIVLVLIAAGLSALFWSGQPANQQNAPAGQAEQSTLTPPHMADTAPLFQPNATDGVTPQTLAAETQPTPAAASAAEPTPRIASARGPVGLPPHRVASLPQRVAPKPANSPSHPKENYVLPVWEDAGGELKLEEEATLTPTNRGAANTPTKPAATSPYPSTGMPSQAFVFSPKEPTNNERPNSERPVASLSGRVQPLNSGGTQPR